MNKTVTCPSGGMEDAPRSNRGVREDVWVRVPRRVRKGLWRSLVAQHTGSVKVMGSNPFSSTEFCRGSSAVEQPSCSAAADTEGGAGSNPVRDRT